MSDISITDDFFSDGFSRWIKNAGYGVASEGDEISVTNQGGEIRYNINVRNDLFCLDRAERAEDPEFTLSSRGTSDIERYLSVQIGGDMRQLMGAPRILFPFREDEVAPGYRLISFKDGLSGLACSGGRALDVRFRDLDYVHPAVQYSYYADAALIDIRRSYSDRHGKPLFAGFLKA